MLQIHKHLGWLVRALVRYRTNIFLCGVVLLLYSAAVAAAPPWIEIHAPHLTVVTDAGEKHGREIALRLEQVRSVFAQSLMKNRLNMPVPLTIIALKKDQQYSQTAPASRVGVAGFFVSGDEHNFIVLNLSREEPWRDVSHDFAHLLLNYNYPPTQGWFDEGFAEYFSSIRLDDKQVQIGGDPEQSASAREDLLGHQTQARTSSKSLTELLSGPVWLPMADLFNMRHEISGPEGTHNTLFYAQSWMVVHYLLNKNKMPETGTYFDLVENQNVPVEEAIQKAYGMTAAHFEQTVKDYFHSLTALFHPTDRNRQLADFNTTAEVYQFPAPLGPDELSVTVTQLQEIDARSLLAEVKARVQDRREEAIKELQSLAAAPSDNEAAHRALAWMHIQRKEFEPASEELSNAAELNPKDPWVRYYLSVLKYRVAQTTRQSIQSLGNMMQDLRAVLDWYPEFAEGYNMLAMARVEGGGTASALEAIKVAIQLSPRNELYVYNLGEIYLSGKKWDAARPVFERLKSSSNPQLATAARRRLDDMEALKKYGIQPQHPLESLNEPPQTVKSEGTAKPELEAKPPASAKQAGADAETNEPDARKPNLPEPAPATGAIQFLKGKLVSVDCSQPPSATLTIVAGTKTLHLRTPDYKSMTLVGADEFSCAWKDRRVSVNYRAEGRSGGNLVSIEVQ
jgi:tetratricopeptide (TPR) repeat protein